VLQELERRGIGPLRVVEDDQERAFLREQVQQPVDRIEEPEAVLRRAGRTGCRFVTGEHVGGEPGEFGGQPVISRQGRQVDAIGDGAQDLPPRPVRRGAGSLRCASPHDDGVRRLRHGGQLLDQPRLPDPGLSAAQHQLRPAGTGRGESVLEDRELPVTADERGAHGRSLQPAGTGHGVEPSARRVP
jgi:hypothetical protein